MQVKKLIRENNVPQYFWKIVQYQADETFGRCTIERCWDT